MIVDVFRESGAIKMPLNRGTPANISLQFSQIRLNVNVLSFTDVSTAVRPPITGIGSCVNVVVVDETDCAAFVVDDPAASVERRSAASSPERVEWHPMKKEWIYRYDRNLLDKYDNVMTSLSLISADTGDSSVRSRRVTVQI
uniref:Uncharacterized protein n=1 Tax=Pristionchus pacificus TaxID=54126 RepID=A0A2A6BNA0_PRIPA|eukprot:PDM67395.1 hypothetical protein PRIPAC_48812 [Pristionchus pacificus]